MVELVVKNCSKHRIGSVQNHCAIYHRPLSSPMVSSKVMLAFNSNHTLEILSAPRDYCLPNRKLFASSLSVLLYLILFILKRSIQLYHRGKPPHHLPSCFSSSSTSSFSSTSCLMDQSYHLWILPDLQISYLFHFS